jgi:cholesterol transport system auxiliary component
MTTTRHPLRHLPGLPFLQPALALLLGLALAGCESFIPGIGPPPNLYTLTPKSNFRQDLPKVDWQLVVEEPLAAGGLDVTRIALRYKPTELNYFAGSAWVDRAPRMVQTLLVESFENSGKIVAVGRQAIGLRSDFNLKSELREFQAEYLSPETAPRVRIRLNAKIVTQPRRDIIASENFEAVAQAKGTAMADIVLAFDEALDRVLRHTVEWTLGTAERKQP